MKDKDLEELYVHSIVFVNFLRNKEYKERYPSNEKA